MSEPTEPVVQFGTVQANSSGSFDFSSQGTTWAKSPNISPSTFSGSRVTTLTVNRQQIVLGPGGYGTT